MFRLVVLSALLAVAAAAPGGVHTVHSAPLAYTSVVAAPALIAQKEISYQKSIIEEPTVAHVGTVLKHVPTGVTHHSSAVVHDTKVQEQVYAPAVKKTIVSTPVEKTTYVQAAPVIAAKTHYVEAAPAAISYAAPVAKTHYVEAAPAAISYAAPLAKTHYVEAAPALAYGAQYAYAAPIAKTAYVSSYPSVYSAPAVYAHDWN